MERPTWVTVVGILGIVFSGFGLLGAVQEMGMPRMMESQRKVFAQMEKDFRQMQEEVRREIEKQEARRMQEEGREEANEVALGEPLDFPMKIFDFLNNLWNVPEWYGIWSVLSGAVKLLVSSFFLFASIGLLQVKLSAIRLFYWAAGLSITLTLMKGGVAFAAFNSWLGIVILVMGLFGVAIDTVLVLVVATGSKDAFHRKLPPPLPANM